MREKSTLLWQFVEIIAQRKLHSFVKEYFRNELRILCSLQAEVLTRHEWSCCFGILVPSRPSSVVYSQTTSGCIRNDIALCVASLRSESINYWDIYTSWFFLSFGGKNGTFSQLGCCWYTSAVYALRKKNPWRFSVLLWQTTFSFVEPHFLKIIFCRTFTPDNQVIPALDPLCICG